MILFSSNMTVLGLFIIGTKTATVLIVSDSGSFSRFNQFSDLHHGDHLHWVFSTWLRLQHSWGRQALLPQHGGPTQGAPPQIGLILCFIDDILNFAPISIPSSICGAATTTATWERSSGAGRPWTLLPWGSTSTCRSGDLWSIISFRHGKACAGGEGCGGLF